MKTREELPECPVATTVQVIGSKFVMYKRNEKDPKIELVSERKKRK